MKTRWVGGWVGGTYRGLVDERRPLVPEVPLPNDSQLVNHRTVLEVSFHLYRRGWVGEWEERREQGGWYEVLWVVGGRVGGEIGGVE